MGLEGLYRGEDEPDWRALGLSRLRSSSTASSSLRRSSCAPFCSFRAASSSPLLSRAFSGIACERVGMSPHSKHHLEQLVYELVEGTVLLPRAAQPEDFVCKNPRGYCPWGGIAASSARRFWGPSSPCSHLEHEAL